MVAASEKHDTSPAPVVKLVLAAADKDGSGTISSQEFEKFVTPTGNWSDAEQEKLFDNADQNKDGELSAAEIEASFEINTHSWPGLADTQWSEEEQQKFTSCFDSDGDGVVSKSEVAEWHKRLDQNGDGVVSSEELSKITDIAQQKLVGNLLQSGDANGDSMLNQEEFGQALLSAGLSKDGLLRLFRSADADGSGSLSAEELRGFVSQIDQNGDGKLSEAEVAAALEHLDKDGSGMLQLATKEGALGLLKVFGPVLAEIAPANARVACQALLSFSSMYLKEGCVKAAATHAARDVGSKVLVSKARKFVLQQIGQATAQQHLEAGGSAAMAATAATPPATPATPAAADTVPQRPELEHAQPELPRPGCPICKGKDRGMRSLRCCGLLMCGRCIGTMISADISACPRCRQQPSW